MLLRKIACRLNCILQLVLPVCLLFPVNILNSQSSSHTNISFQKNIITGDFVSEGVAVGDVNHDGKTDIMAGAFWFEAPNWTRHEIDDAKTFNPDTAYSNSFLNFSMDVDGDGWIDFIRVGFPGKEVVWYQNPANKPGHWKMYTICSNIGNESPAFVDVDGDGRPDILCNDPVNKEVVWFKSPSGNGDTVWKRYSIYKGDIATAVYTHGLGLGDINGDGRKDVIITKGWWEAPANVTQPNWVFHPVDLGEDCSEMYTLDVDGDGDADVISASAHNYGIWWHEQVKDDAGNIVFRHHTISKLFSESHGLALADINGDGHPDLITGKRWYAHNGNDPGGKDAAVLYWFEFKPGKEPEWIPHFMDDNSGVGLHVVVQDMNGDGLPDIVIGNKKGIFLFEQERGK